MDKKICPILTQGLLGNEYTSPDPVDIKDSFVYCLKDKCEMWTGQICGLRSNK